MYAIKVGEIYMEVILKEDYENMELTKNFAKYHTISTYENHKALEESEFFKLSGQVDIPEDCIAIIGKIIFDRLHYQSAVGRIVNTLIFHFTESKVQEIMNILNFRNVNNYNINIDKLVSSTRAEPVNTIRKIMMYFCYKHGTVYDQIGRFFGDRDHATIIHGCKSVISFIKAYPLFYEMIKEIDNKLKSQKI